MTFLGFTSEHHSAPQALMAYANDAVFKEEFRNNISYQTDDATAAFKDGIIDVNTFMDCLAMWVNK